MASLIHQKVTSSASPRELFNIYLDSKKHGAAICRSAGKPAADSRHSAGCCGGKR